jgi:hypothetical protein
VDNRRKIDRALAEGAGRRHGIAAAQDNHFGPNRDRPVPVPDETQIRRALAETYDLANTEDRPALVAAYLAGWHASRTVFADPVGIPEIGQRLGVERTTVDQWRQRGVLPDPDWTIGGRPAWDWLTIRLWADETGRTAKG